jgi:DNA mismatch endonuclease, patch repair protein
MSRIRNRNTSLEVSVRKYLHSEGLRFRLHDRKLLGSPDVVLASRRVCLFIHGCFWHGCQKCAVGKRRVLSNREFWSAKIVRNQKRDRRNARALRKLGWHVFTLWECEVKRSRPLEVIARRIMRMPS